MPHSPNETPVVELALLRLISPFSTSNSTILKNLAHATQVLTSASHSPFHIYTQHEDPSLLYVLGSWPTLAAHTTFLASDTNVALLERVKDQITVEWMFHIDIQTLNGIPLEAPVLEIARFKGRAVSENARGFGFVRAVEDTRGALGEVLKGRRWALGRRVDGEVEEEEYVLFCGWQSEETHVEFAGKVGEEGFLGIRGFLVEADVKHARRLDLGGDGEPHIG